MVNDKKLFFFVGSLESSFVQNELVYTNKFYPNAVIIYKNGKYDTLQNLKCVYDFEFVQINKISLLSIFSKVFWDTLCMSEIRKELYKIIKSRRKILYKLFYAIYYIFIYVAFDTSYSLDIYDKNQIILYSYWLSNSAFICCMIKNKLRKYNVSIHVISRAHGYDMYEYRNRAEYLPFREFILSKCDRIYPISTNGEAYLKSYGYTDKITVSRLGTSKYNVSIEKAKCSNTIVFGSCSSIISIKRLDLIVDFIKKISSCTSLEIKWIHIGDGKLYKEIEKKAKETLDENQYVFYGYVENKEVRNILVSNKIDYFINLSDSEGIPVSIMEAMSLGIPALARNVGGMKEIIISNKTGFLIDENLGNLDMAIDYILKNFNNNELRHSVYDFWYENFNADANYSYFYSNIQDLSMN